MSAEIELLKTPKFKVVQRETASGSSCIICHPGAVVILPLLPERKLCLIYNHRKAVDERLLELPAGTLEPGESPAEAAVRELAEETGYRARRVEPLVNYFVSPGIMNEQMHAFLAMDLKSGPTHLMDDEEIEPVEVGITEAIEWIREGRIRDAKSIATLLYFAQFHADRFMAK